MAGEAGGREQGKSSVRKGGGKEEGGQGEGKVKGAGSREGTVGRRE